MVGTSIVREQCMGVMDGFQYFVGCETTARASCEQAVKLCPSWCVGWSQVNALCYARELFNISAMSF